MEMQCFDIHILIFAVCPSEAHQKNLTERNDSSVTDTDLFTLLTYSNKLNRLQMSHVYSV